jgi:hypothetical protein
MKYLKSLSFGSLLALCFLVGGEPALALTISPVKIEVAGDPGQVLRGEIELLNEQVLPKVFFSSFENFEPSGDTGSPKFIGATGGLATWLQTEKSVPVATGETVKVPFTITIPTDAEAGGYFAAIFWGEQDPITETAGEVAIGGKLGVLLLLRVRGDIVEEAGISEFAVASTKKVHSGLPIMLSYRFANSGGDRVVPLGDIIIKNSFGSEVVTLAANRTEGNVLPGSSRKFEAVWGDIMMSSASTSNFLSKAKQQFSEFHFGFYKAELSLVYGATNQPASASIWFFILPWQLLLLVLIALCLAWWLLKRYNAWIVSKSKSNS